MDSRFDEMRLLLGHTIGVATTAHLRSQELDRRYELSEGEQRSMSGRIDDIERRLSHLEGKTRADRIDTGAVSPADVVCRRA